MRRYVLPIVTFIVLAGGVQATSAAEKTSSAEYDRCMAAAGPIQPAMDECMRAEAQRQDDALNVAYRKLMAKLPPERQQYLREAERAWLAFRDKECDFEYSRDAGYLMGPTVSASCQLTMTENRVRELRKLLSSEYP
jgi:uncharacterized protein YecT (DUF1311 family)